jgi:ElaA protein
LIRTARFEDLTPAVLYALIRLRIDVFVVEQRCPYPELDGRDLEPGTRHVWAERDGVPVAYLRILEQPDGAARIGRVCVSFSQRRTGIARELMRHALDLVGDRRSVLDAQAHLVGFYASFGFAPTGPEYDDDGIPHVPMAR